MEGPVLLSLLMLGFVSYMIFQSGVAISLPVIVVQPSPVPVVAGPVVNPVEQVMIPVHSIWAD